MTTAAESATPPLAMLGSSVGMIWALAVGLASDMAWTPTAETMSPAPVAASATTAHVSVYSPFVCEHQTTGEPS